MFDIFNAFATDPKRELEGAWVEIAPGTSIKVARTGNKKHGRIVSKLYEANKTTLDSKGDEADAVGEQITIQGMAEAILLDWKNLGYRGEAVPDGWNLDVAKKLLQHKDFRALVDKHAGDMSRFKIVQDEATSGN